MSVTHDPAIRKMVEKQMAASKPQLVRTSRHIPKSNNFTTDEMESILRVIRADDDALCDAVWPPRFAATALLGTPKDGLNPLEEMWRNVQARTEQREVSKSKLAAAITPISAQISGKKT